MRTALTHPEHAKARKFSFGCSYPHAQTHMHNTSLAPAHHTCTVSASLRDPNAQIRTYLLTHSCRFESALWKRIQARLSETKPGSEIDIVEIKKEEVSSGNSTVIIIIRRGERGGGGRGGRGRICCWAARGVWMFRGSGRSGRRGGGGGGGAGRGLRKQARGWDKLDSPV